MNDAHDYDDTITTGPEFQQLWHAVIHQALNDAMSTGMTSGMCASAKRLARDRARAWFQSGDADFQEVCSLAGLEPEVVRKGALEAINKHIEAPKKRRSNISKAQQATC